MTNEELKEQLVLELLEVVKDNIDLREISIDRYKQKVVDEMKRIAEATKRDPDALEDFIERGLDAESFLEDVLSEANIRFHLLEG